MLYYGRNREGIVMGFRIERVEKIIERELANILFEDAKNSKLKFISITKVSLSKDMAVANVWFTVLGKDDEMEATAKELAEAKGYLRSELAHRLDLRKTPELRFKYDESLAYGNKITAMLEELNKK